MRGNNSRGGRVNSDVQRVISHVIEFEIKDPRVSSLVSVTRCDVTNDLKECKAYISVLGSDEDAENTMEGLGRASGFIRKRLAESLNLRYTPQIEFKLDKSIEYGVMMSKKIDDVLGANKSTEDTASEDADSEEDDSEE
ncbi:MAG: 30S ribosome-binding factor RbfA [Eubacterium sp.]|nr:30S ribosome-binding factor RbfA [Eubacterium sp.]